MTEKTDNMSTANYLISLSPRIIMFRHAGFYKYNLRDDFK
jgi:hypothetical protein